jgi:hypothetical protein
MNNHSGVVRRGPQAQPTMLASYTPSSLIPNAAQKRMQLSRQTHLGSVDTKLLAIVDLQGTPAWPCTIIQSEKAYILHRLPDELLLLVVKFSLYTNGHTTRETTHVRWALFEDTRAGDTSCIMALSQVCHRFKRIAQPLLFRNIGFIYPDQMMPPSIQVLRLHRTLSDRVDLRQHCRWVVPSIFSRLTKSRCGPPRGHAHIMPLMCTFYCP